MGPITYYAPFFVGLLLPFGLHQAFLESPQMAGLEDWEKWTRIGLYGLGLAFYFQGLMFGAQGAFAQVLPVPFGKSVRGRSAVVAGGTLLAALIAAAAFRFLQSEGSTTPSIVAGSIAAIAAVVSLGAYVWAWPLAVRDFAAR